MNNAKLVVCGGEGGGGTMHRMTKTTFKILYNPETGLEYVCKAVDEYTKYHRENENENEGDGSMPEMPPGNPLCPVLSFQRYLEKLNPNCDRLWQRPRASFLPEEPCWYTNSPIEEKSYNSLCRNSAKNVSSRKGTQIIVFE